MKKINEGFIIDLDTGEVCCRKCRAPCRSIKLSDFTAFACFSSECMNPYELHRYSNDTWKVYGIGVLWGEEVVQKRLLDFLIDSLAPKEPK